MSDEIASAQVDAFIRILQERYHLNDDDMHDLVHTLLRLRKRARFAEAMGEWTAKTIIVVLVTAFFSGVGFAIIHFVDAIARR